jgi:hypothetical protein
MDQATYYPPGEHRVEHAVIPNVGDEAPDFSVADSSGGERSLGSLVANGPCVLIFYRGHW